MKILVINCGSSSLKYQLIDMENESVLAKGLCERIGIVLEEFLALLLHMPLLRLSSPDYVAALNRNILLQHVLHPR